MTVGIVGMGIAGLRAALLLERHGVTVKLFEARDRIGGRLATWTDSIEDVRFETGGEWIDADNVRVLSLLREFGLSSISADDSPRRIIFEEAVCYSNNLWSEAFEDELRLEAAAVELCRGLRSPPWANRLEIEKDHRPLSDFVRLQTNSPRGKWYLTNKLRSDEGEDLDQVGFLGWLSGYMHYLDREQNAMSAFRIQNGSVELMNGLRERIQTDINCGAVLRKIEQSDSGVVLRFEGFEERVDRVILTLPPRLLEQVVFEPALSVSKRCAIEACGMGRAVKITWQFKSKWWLERGWNGSMHCDGPLQQTWDASLGGAPVMSAYICGTEAQKWTELGDPVNAGLYVLTKLYPEAGVEFVRGWFSDWIHDPFSRGGFSFLATGYVIEHMQHMVESEGRIHFAGEHTSLWTGFIEGALDSAERASAEAIL